MIASETILCAIPAACWENNESKYMPVELLRRFLHDLAKIERRLPKNVALDDEQYRYARLCGQIEQVALSNAVFAPTQREFQATIKQGHFPVIRIGSEYVDLLRQVHLDSETGPVAQGRLGASIFSPRELKSHVRYFTKVAQAYEYQYYPAIKHRDWFLTKRVLKSGCGLVEVPNPLCMPILSENQPRQGGADGRSLWEQLLAYFRTLIWQEPQPVYSAEERRSQTMAEIVPLTESTDWQQYGAVHRRGHFMKDRLRAQIRAALVDEVPVNLMNQRQNMVTEILQEFIHKEMGQQPVEAPVMYNDGRTARPFPLYSLSHLPVGWAPTKEYHIGLISMRHLALDQYIDMNWYRNVEVPSRDGLASSDEFCFQFSMEQLAELLDANRGHHLRIHLYHTGYMPAIVGFYRAVVSTLASGKYKPGCLQILPKLQPGEDGFVEGLPWPE